MSCIRLRASARVIAGCCECERGHLSHGSAQRKVRFLTCISLALKVASASRARLVGHVRPPRLPFPTSDGPPGGRWRSGFASTRLHAPAQPHTESPRSMRLKGALLERTRDDPPSLYPLTWRRRLSTALPWHLCECVRRFCAEKSCGSSRPVF